MVILPLAPKGARSSHYVFLRSQHDVNLVQNAFDGISHRLVDHGIHVNQTRHCARAQVIGDTLAARDGNAWHFVETPFQGSASGSRMMAAAKPMTSNEVSERSAVEI